MSGYSGPSKSVTVRVPEDLLAAYDELVEISGIERSEWFRQGLAVGLPMIRGLAETFQMMAEKWDEEHRIRLQTEAFDFVRRRMEEEYAS